MRRARISALAVHPSAKVALSAGGDSTVRLWDLTKGKPVFTLPLGKEPLGVQWTPDASGFLALFTDSLAFYSADSGKCEKEWAVADKLLDLAVVEVDGVAKPKKGSSGAGAASPQSGWVAVVGAESGTLWRCAWDGDGKATPAQGLAKTRIKRIAKVPGEKNRLACACGDGSVVLLRVSGSGPVGQAVGEGKGASAGGKSWVDVQATLLEARGARPTAIVTSG